MVLGPYRKNLFCAHCIKLVRRQSYQINYLFYSSLHSFMESLLTRRADGFPFPLGKQFA